MSTGGTFLRKRSPEGALQDQPSARRVVLVESEGTLEAVDVSSTAQSVSIRAVATERSPSVCEGELCGMSSSSVRHGIGHDSQPFSPSGNSG